MGELYLACYVVETRGGTLGGRTPYIDSDDKFLPYKDLRPHVLRDEEPLAVVRFNLRSGGKCKTDLDRILRELNFELGDQDRWCAQPNNRFTTVLYYLMSKNEIPGALRDKVLSHTYSVDDFNPQFFADHISSFDIKYWPPQSEPQNSRRPLRRRVKLPQRTMPKIPDLKNKIRETGVDELLENLLSLANESDSLDGFENLEGDKRAFRYKKTAPLAICQFIERIRPHLASCQEDSCESSDRRTPLMRLMQDEAEGVALPVDNRSNDQWITTADLSVRIGGQDREKVRKANSTLTRERGNNKRIWPNDEAVPEGGGDSGWAFHKRFWRKKPNAPHPIFYYHETIDEDWERCQSWRLSGDDPQ